MKLSARIPRDAPSQFIRATAKGITEIDSLPPRFGDCSELFISENSISRIDRIDQFRWLSRLMIEYNLISYVEHLLPLGSLANLVELRLEGNPVCKWPLWDIFTINICLKLKLLNGKPVIRGKNQYLLELEQRILESMYSLQIAKDVAGAMASVKNPTPQKIAKIISDAMKKLPRTEFINSIRMRSGMTDPSSYMDHLVELAKSKAKSCDGVFPAGSGRITTLLSQMADASDDIEAFVKAAESLSACALGSVGVNDKSGVLNALSGLIDDAEMKRLRAATECQPSPQVGKPKLPFLNLQQMNEPSQEVYSPGLAVQAFPKQSQFERAYEPVLEIQDGTSFEKAPEECDVPKPSEEELKQFQEQQEKKNDEEEAGAFDGLVQQEMTEEALSQRYYDSEYFSENSGEGSSPRRRRRRLSSWMSGTSGSDASPSSARSRRDRRDRRKSLHENWKAEVVREFASRPNGFLVWKFFKVWTLRQKQRINSRMRRKMLASSVSGMIPRVQLPTSNGGISTMQSFAGIPRLQSVGELPPMNQGMLPMTDSAGRLPGLRGSGSFFFSARDRRAFPVPVIPAERKDMYNQQMKQFVENPIGNILGEPLKRAVSARARSRSDLSDG